MRGIPSLNPYSYHFVTGRSGYFGSIGGNGLLAPLEGWAPASICIEIDTTMRAPPGQNRVRADDSEDSVCAEALSENVDVPLRPRAAAAPVPTKCARFKPILFNTVGNTANLPRRVT
jgi:hypothetical protein